MGKCCSKKDNTLADSLKITSGKPGTLILVNDIDRSYERIKIKKNSNQDNITDGGRK
jgi:hypothetical protein